MPVPWIVLGLPILISYRIVVEWVLCIELPWGVTLGPNARIHHGFGTVVNNKVRIGSNVLLRNGTTIGVKRNSEFGATDVPVIGDSVDIGANVVIIGRIRIGNHVTIGAGSVVLTDVPDYAVVVGNPARIIRINDPMGAALPRAN